MNRTAKQFEGLLSRYFETLLQDNPTFSTICAGLRDGEGKLGRLTPDFHKKRERERQSALRALEGISPRELTGEQQHVDHLPGGLRVPIALLDRTPQLVKTGWPCTPLALLAQRQR